MPTPPAAAARWKSISASVTRPCLLMPSNVAALMTRFRSVTDPRTAGSKTAPITPPFGWLGGQPLKQARQRVDRGRVHHDGGVLRARHRRLAIGFGVAGAALVAACSGQHRAAAPGEPQSAEPTPSATAPAVSSAAPRAKPK